MPLNNQMIFNLRQCNKSDFKEVYRLLQKQIEYQKNIDPLYIDLIRNINTRREIENWFSDESLIIYGAFSGSRLLGYLVMRIGSRPPARPGWRSLIKNFLLNKKSGKNRINKRAYIMDCFVDKENRRSGIATALVRESCTQASSAGVSRVVLDVLFNNRTAWKFWKKMGFREKRIFMIKTEQA